MKGSAGKEENSCWSACWKEIEVIIFLSPSPEQVEAGLLKLLGGTAFPFELLGMLLI